jgi:hypothetical protein
MERKVIYFEKPGKKNTSACFMQAIKDNSYKHLVVATTGGDTGILFSEALKTSKVNLIVVTHSAGFKEPNTSEIPNDAIEKIKANGAKIYTGTILTHSLETAFSSN